MKKTFFLLASLIICVLSRAQVAPAEFEDKSYLKGDVNARKTRPTGIAEIRTATGLVSELGSIADFSSVAADARVLTIQNKQLQSLDHSVLRLRQLQVLDVSHNDLTDIDNSVFSSLPELKKVYVNNNRIPDTRVDEWRQLFPGIRFFTDKDIYTLETP